MKTVQLFDKSFSLLITAEVIQQHVSTLGKRISKDYSEKDPLFIVILNGAFMFAADLLRHVTIPATVSFVKLSSYNALASTNKVKTLLGINENLEGKNIIIIDDILDTGNTLAFLKAALLKKKAATLKTVVCFHKKNQAKFDIIADYACIETDAGFLVGYGLDYNGYGRNLKDIYHLDK